MLNKNICTFHLLHLIMAMVCTGASQQTLQNLNSEAKLSRQRRYLIFPTGSSVQLVYEFSVTVPDYTMYVTTGITVALAWNLPDKPTYPEDQHNNRIKNGPSVDQMMVKKKNGSNSNYVDDNLKPLFLKSNKNEIVNRIANYASHYFQNRRPDSYYFGRNSSFGLRNYTNYHHYYPNGNGIGDGNGDSTVIRPPYSTSAFDSANPSNDAMYMIETYLKPFIKSLEIASKHVSHAKAEKVVPKPRPITKKLHTIYPALKKRYVRETTATYEQNFYLDHHRRTRHRLYEIIEKYLFAKGYNGTECVLKTLCEVRQKHHDTEPGSFLVEIIRAVFSLPAAQSIAEQKRHNDYDNAHRIANDCAINFPLCPENIWSAQFIIESDTTIY